MARIPTFDAFWPYYLSEHRNPLDRALHFVGTTLFFLSMAASVAFSPVWFPIALPVAALAAWWGAARLEPHRPAFVAMLLMFLPLFAASPFWVVGGMVTAYAFAWVGHFGIEGNRPATFKYPVWSFLCDFRMWGHMARGRLWSGDPLVELKLSS